MGNIKALTSYRNTDEYNYLVEHCQAILKTRIKNSRLENILAYAEIGEEIIKNPLYKKFGKGNQDFLRTLFDDIGISQRSGYYSVDFYENFLEKKIKKGEWEDVCTGVQTMIKEYFDEGENISWNKIKKNYLTEQKQKLLPLPEGKFRVIYADPPWQFDNEGFEQSAEQQYPTMPVKTICDMKIREKVGEKAVLFLWVTNAFLEEGLKVCKEWGFEYKTNMIWIKDKGPTIGWFTQSRHEMLFIATKGEGVHPKEKLNSWFEAPVTKHSKKPEKVYDMIERMYEGPYLELFARNKRKGWQSWGNEI